MDLDKLEYVPGMATTRQRIAFVDDHVVILDLLREMVLTRFADRLEIVGQATNAREAIELLTRTRPDLLVLDIYMPDGDGIQILRRARAMLPGVRVVLFSGSHSQLTLAEASQLGVSAFVSKGSSSQRLFDALRIVLDGGRYFDPITASLSEADGTAPSAQAPLATPAASASAGAQPTVLPGSVQFTNREREVLQLIAVGHTNKEIAAKLGISAKTVEKHRGSLMRKLNVHDAVSLARYAIRSGLVVL